MAGPVCLGNITAPKEWKSSALLIDNILGHKIKKLIAGPHHYCAITSEGKLITWGFNVDLFSNDNKPSGQLGHINNIISPPFLIDSSYFQNEKIISAACGSSHTLILTESGDVYSFGSNTHQQLGRPGEFRTEQHHCIEMIPPFLFKQNKKILKIEKISCGATHCVVLSSGGIAWSWGNNILGQCGSSSLGILLFPHKIDMPESSSHFIDVTCGFSHTLLLTNHGKMYTMGSNLFGQLGTDEISVYSSNIILVHIPNIQNEIVVQISCGIHSSSCILSNGILYCWGILRSEDKENNQYIPVKNENCYQQHIYITSVSEGLDNLIITSENKISQSLRSLTQCCRFEYVLKYDELFKALNDIPHYLLGEIQQRAVKWLHEMYSIRPYLMINSPNLCFDIIDSRNLTDFTLTTLNKGKITGGSSLSQSLIQNITITNPHSKQLQIDIFIQKKQYDTKNSSNHLDDNFQLIYSPSQFILGKFQSKSIEIILKYSRKEPPSPQNIILSITARRKNKKLEPPNPSGTSRHFIYIQLRTIQRTRRGNRGFLVNTSDSNDFINYDDEDENYFNSLLDQDDDEGCKNYNKKINNHLVPYLPHILLSRFNDDPTPPNEPFVESFPAAILFVDISGFTSLNEKLAELGPAGPERVSHHINSYFTSLIKEVNDHGGDTLKFAGDALICMFGSPKSNESLENLTRKATQCALNIQTCLAKYDSNQGFTLTLHVGIGAGTIYALYLGGVQRSWEFLVTGEPLVQLRTCVDLSSTGEVVVSKQVWDLISSYFHGEIIKDSENHDYLVTNVKHDHFIEVTSLSKQFSNKNISTSNKFEVVARYFIPKAVQVQIDSNQTKWMDELRVVTVLFVKLNSEIQSSSMNEFCKKLQEFLVIMQTEIFRFDGMVRQFLADDKGTVLIAAFGLPPSSHLDGGLRAIRSAIAIHKNLKNVNMQNSIGITTGHVFCGAVGSIDRREYAMVGDTVNLSARLMVAASKFDPKEINILCDKQTAEACKGKQDLVPLDPIYVKGKSNPIEIYRPISKNFDRRQRWRKNNAKTKFFRTCVGRDQEIGIITKQLQIIKTPDSTSQSSLLVLTEGDSGTGKTSLASLCHSKAIRFGFHCFTTSGDSIATTQTFFIWKAVIENIITSSKYVKDWPKASGELMFNVALKLCGPQHGEYISLLQQVIPQLEIPDDFIIPSSIQKLNSNQKQLRLTQLIAQMINSRIKEGIPLFIVIDDLQWVDFASLQLLSYILTNIPRIFFLCAMRPLLEKESKLYLEIQKITQMSQSTVIKLLPFGDEQTKMLVMELLSVYNVPKQLLQILHAAQGSPMYLAEIIYHLLSKNAIFVEDNRVKLVEDIGKPNFSFFFYNSSNFFILR